MNNIALNLQAIFRAKAIYKSDSIPSKKIPILKLSLFFHHLYGGEGKRPAISKNGFF